MTKPLTIIQFLHWFYIFTFPQQINYSFHDIQLLCFIAKLLD